MDARRCIELVMKLQINGKRIENENDHSNETKDDDDDDDDNQVHDNKKLNDHSLVSSSSTYMDISRSDLPRSYRGDVRIGMRIFSS